MNQPEVEHGLISTHAPLQIRAGNVVRAGNGGDGRREDEHGGTERWGNGG